VPGGSGPASGDAEQTLVGRSAPDHAGAAPASPPPAAEQPAAVAESPAAVAATESPAAVAATESPAAVAAAESPAAAPVPDQLGDGATTRLTASPAADDEPTLAQAAPAPEAATPSPDAVTPAGDGVPEPVPDGAQRPAQPPRKRLSSAGALIWVLLLLFGFTLVVQLRSNDTDDSLASARQEDLVRILSDLEARDTRLQAEITALETSQRQLSSGVEGRQAALQETRKRAEELGLLAGTLPGRGPGLEIRINGVKASALLNAVQELRGAGGEVMEVAGGSGGSVRIVASTYFVDDGAGNVVVDGTRLAGPYTLWVIGPAQTMRTALEIPGGVVASVKSGGGSVTMEQHTEVDVTAVRKASSLQYARPVS
jgi:uncharacterized protein YlxW (UPF0749 family)